MFRNFFVVIFAALLVAQVSRADEVDDAEAALADLRQAISDVMMSGFEKHAKMAMDVDMAALKTKDADEFSLKCVDIAADNIITQIYMSSSKLADDALKSSFDKEMAIVHCGRSDTECLTAVTDEINEMTAGLEDIVNGAIEADQAEIDKKVQEMILCAV